MRAAALLCLALTALTALGDTDPRNLTSVITHENDSNNRKFSTDDDRKNTTVIDEDGNGNETISEPHEDGDHEPVVRKKRTFGDIVFRGLADVLGYNVARKPPQAAFPPPLAPVPGIDAPLAGPPPAAPPPPPPPCGAPRAAAPPPCRAVAPPPPPPPPPKPRPPPPCPKPRAAPKPKPRPPPPPPPPCATPRANPATPAPCAPPPPPPPPPPPCATPRANPATPAPCAPPPPPPPPKADNLETIQSNFRLQFDFNRKPASPAPAAAAPAAAEGFEEREEVAPIAFEPRAARLPAREPPRRPRVFVDAFVVRNGQQHRVRTVDANRVASDDYLAYDDEEEEREAPAYDDYEDVQESRDRAKAVREFGTAVDAFWEQKQKPKKEIKKKKKLPANHYRSVHFGDRDLADQIQRRSDSRERHQSLSERERPQRVPIPVPDAEEDSESTTTTEDPRRPLRPRVLPPTEHNPGQIDTVTVRVPPIYKEKRPRKLNHGRPERPDRDEEENSAETSDSEEEDSEGENSIPAAHTEPPRRQRRKKTRRTRSADDAYSAGDYDYYGRKLPISDEEKHFMQLTIPAPTKDSDIARLERAPPEDSYFLDDHERLQEDPERIGEDERSDDSGHTDESGRADGSGRLDSKDSERLVEDRERASEDERAGEDERSDSRERTDKLSPNARIRETGYENKYLHATNVRQDDPRPLHHTGKRKTLKKAA